MAETASSIPWRPAFVQAIKLELEPYWDALEFIAEYPLTAEPLEIDEEDGHSTVIETAPGIHQIAGYPLPIQVIESKKLPFEENLWLKGLAKDLNPAMAGSILEASRKKGKEAEVAAYLYALINANQKTIEEALAMVDEGLPFDRWVEETGLAAKWNTFIPLTLPPERRTWGLTRIFFPFPQAVSGKIPIGNG
jgi:hypothetical protein